MSQVEKSQKYPRPKVIYIDVDKILIDREGQVNSQIANWPKHMQQAGFQIIIWSSRGTEHYGKAVERAGFSDIVLAAISKPGYIVDDKGWSWIKYTHRINEWDILEHPANQAGADRLS